MTWVMAATGPPEHTGGMADDVTRPGPATRDPTGTGRGVGAPVVAGVDGSPADDPVTDWAADEAARTGRPLRLVHAIEPGFQLTPYEAVLGELPTLSEGLRGVGRDLVAAAAERVTARHPDLVVEQVVAWGPPAAVLLDEADDAAWLVLGVHRRSRLERVLMGSVARPALVHARCPVVVVPAGHEASAPRRVVVGVDASPGSVHAVRLAMETAAAAGGSVTCVLGWTVEVIDGVVVTEPGSPHWVAVEERYEHLVHEAVDPVAAAHPDVPIDVVVRHGGASQVVVELAEELDADLVVVGSRGRGGFVGLLLGSVSRRVIEHAATVVAVAH